ncbi:hypothetical protein SNE40_013622 [Patella caerulea]|uniref:DNA-(apurinic or apyrimidinic site) endonuclease n=1 Tax=Patella caerulea TaxID=87958 RepID=A0AAN8JCN4_PATCE
MKVLTWNINGIRASKKSLKVLFDSLDADIICLQETKVTRDMLDEPSAIVEGYNAYYSFSRKRSGYSGVATFCKDTAAPCKAEEGLSGILTSQSEDSVGFYGNLNDFDGEDKELESLDAEGRAVITQHRIKCKDGEIENVAIINVYVPRAAEREDRQQYKLRFLSLLQNRAETLLQNNSHVIVLGDINTTHSALDNCDTESEEFTKRPSRLWMNQFLRESDRDPKLQCNDEESDILGGTMTPNLIGGLFVDSFRNLHPDQEGAFTNWCTTTNARENNYGRRLDYILTNEKLHVNCVTDAIIMPEIEGSDHCPVKVNYDFEIVIPKKCPSLCTKFMPEFRGSQQKLSSFFVKKPDSNVKISDAEKELKSQEIVSLKVPVITNSCQSESLNVTNLKKRASDSVLSTSKSKRSKMVKSEVSKQSSLKTFFVNPKKTEEKLSPSKLINLKFSEHIPKSPDSKAIPIQTKTSPYFNKASESKSVVKSAVLGSGEGTASTKSSSSSAWKSLLSGPGKAPLCKGHKEPCVLRTVKKDGPNKNKQFYVCARGEGHSSNPEARCDHFVWVNHKSK